MSLLLLIPKSCHLPTTLSPPCPLQCTLRYLLIHPTPHPLFLPSTDSPDLPSTLHFTHSFQINGFSAINLTKLDVLSGLPELKIGVAYRGPDGALLPAFPADLDLLAQVKVKGCRDRERKGGEGEVGKGRAGEGGYQVPLESCCMVWPGMIPIGLRLLSSAVQGSIR